MSKAIIAGGRDYYATLEDEAWLDKMRIELAVDRVISGGAPGADKFGERWAEERNIPIDRFPAEWTRYGKRAGLIRNEKMACVADICILFPGGFGTADMKRRAIAHSLVIREREAQGGGKR